MSDQEQPYHARGGDIYHLDPLCPVGRQLPLEWRVPGSAGLAVCPTCWARSKARRPSGPYVPTPPGATGRAPRDGGKSRGQG
jgi:hypothetical protein